MGGWAVLAAFFLCSEPQPAGLHGSQPVVGLSGWSLQCAAPLRAWRACFVPGLWCGAGSSLVGTPVAAACGAVSPRLLLLPNSYFPVVLPQLPQLYAQTAPGLSRSRVGDAMIPADRVVVLLTELDWFTEFSCDTERLLLLAQYMSMRWLALAFQESRDAATRWFGGVHVALVRSGADGGRMTAQ